MVVGAMNLSADELVFSAQGYATNSYGSNSEHAKHIEYCLSNNYKSGNNLGLYTPNGKRVFNGNSYSLCSRINHFLDKNDPSNIHCGKIYEPFEDISFDDDKWDLKRLEQISNYYLKSAKDDKLDDINKTYHYNLKVLPKNIKLSRMSIKTIQEGYLLFKSNTTGRIIVNNNVTFGKPLVYMLDHTPLNSDTLRFADLIGTENYEYPVRGYGRNNYGRYNGEVDRLKGMSNYSSLIDNNFLEKAFLMNLMALDYKTYIYNQDIGNIGKCYNFDVTKYDKTNIRFNNSNGENIISAKKFLWEDNNTYYSTKPIITYSIHKANTNDKSGVYKNQKVTFSVNVRASESNSIGNLKIDFYPDNDYLEQKDGKLYLRAQGRDFKAKDIDAKYTFKSNDKEYDLALVKGNNGSYFTCKKCPNVSNTENITIFEEIQGEKRPIFQESGTNIIKGEVERKAAEAVDLSFKTVYVDNENDSVIKNNQINENAKYGDAIYTTLANKDFYVKLDAKKSDVYVDFTPNGNFSIDKIYNELGIVKKGEKTEENPCGDKYALDNLVLKLTAKDPRQINNISYTQYKQKVVGNKKVCEILQNDKNETTFKSNDFAIRPEYFETKPSDKITQEAGKIVTHNFVSKDLKGFNDLQIGYSKIELREDDLSIVEKAGEGMKFTADKSQPIDNKGNFNLNINFPVSTVVDLELAETNFANNDKNNGYCIGADNSFDKNSANTKVNGKIHCYVPMKDKIQVEFTSNTKALKDEYSYCNDIDTCKNYDKTTGEIQIDAVNKIGIKNPAYDKLMVGDKNGLVYTLNLVSTNSDDKYVPTKYNNPLSLVVSLKVDDEALLSNANIINNNPSYEKGTTDNSAIIKLEISKDTLNEKYKKALSDLLTQPNITLSAHTQNYDIDDVKFEDSTVFFFNKNKIIPAQTVELDVKVNGRDDFDITFNKDYDVAYTGLIFKDVKAKGDVLKLKYNDDFFFGYYDKNYNFVDDSKNFKESNIDSKISFQTTYNTTSVLNNEFKNNSTTQYVKDSVRFFSKTEYLNNSKNSFTIEFIR